MELITIHPVSQKNWEEAIQITVHEDQREFVPSVLQSLAYAYIKPWDEALDPFVLYRDGKAIGFFYVSYTPSSIDNYWIGGFQIDKQFQRKGYGKKAFIKIIEFLIKNHSNCQVISLTVEKENIVAQNLYKRLGFISENSLNQEGEIIYRIKLK